MESIEERVLKLENKVKELEETIKKSEFDRNNTSLLEQRQQIQKPQLTPYQYQQEQQRQQYLSRQSQQKQQNTVKKESKIKETLIGKYFIGALASLLVFIGAISLIGLIWNDLTPEIKLLLISSAGILLTVLGFWLIKTKKNPITSIILGTGAGLLFISILSANMSFNLIDSNLAIILACIWAVFFILSSRYTNLFFTTIIAYIGSYIALILGLFLIKGDLELLVMTLFVTIISFTMMFNAHKNKRNIEIIISIILTFLSYSTILFRSYFDGFMVKEKLLDNCIIQTIVIIVLYILLNVLSRLIDKKRVPWNLIFSLFTTILTSIHISYISDNYVYINFLNCLIIFFAINLGQMILSYLLKNLVKWTTIYYIVILVINSILINLELFDSPTGVVVIVLFLIIIENIFNYKQSPVFIGFIVFLDSLFLLISHSNEPIFIVYGILHIVLIFYLLFKNKCLNIHQNINILKIIGTLIIVFNSFTISEDIEYIINKEFYMSGIIGYLISVLGFSLMLKLGYFNKWTEEKFIIKLDTKINIDINLRKFFYLISTLLYIIGLQQLSSTYIWYQQLLVLIPTMIITFIQSYNLILNRNEKNERLSGIWMGLKYLILSWTIINSFFSLDINSVIYSVVGLLIAIGSISFGFIFKFKSLRLYGLILTIIMVAKFILVDLVQENSITRVIALIFGGLICFGISVIYNKLENKIKDYNSNQ